MSIMENLMQDEYERSNQIEKHLIYLYENYKLDFIIKYKNELLTHSVCFICDSKWIEKDNSLFCEKCNKTYFKIDLENKEYLKQQIAIDDIMFHN